MELLTTKKQIYTPFLTIAFVSFILGIILANHTRIDFVILYVLVVCALAFVYFLKNQTIRDILIILMFFVIGILHQINSTTLASDDIYYLSRQKLSEVSLKGIVASQIQEGPFDKSFVFYARYINTTVGATRRVAPTKVSGKVYVRFNKRVDLYYGERLSIEGKLSDIKDEGYFNKNLIRQGIRSVLYVGRKDWIAKEDKGSFSLKKLAFEIRDKLKSRFEKVVSPQRDILIAFILGDRSGLSKELYSVFKSTGTVHILAISGLHIGIIVFTLIVFLKVARVRLKARFICLTLFLIFYSFVTGLRPSVVRAVIMGATFLFSFIVKREYHIYNSLALAAMIILAIWPWQIFDIGFQLSFISVFCIIFISPKILSVLPKFKNRFLYFIQVSFIISLSAWLAATPLVAYYFGIISLISAVVNVFVVLLMPFIIAGGFIYLFMSFLIPFLTKWIALSLEFMIDILILLAISFRNLPFSHFYIERFQISVLFIYYGLIVVFFGSLLPLIIRKRFQKYP